MNIATALTHARILDVLEWLDVDPPNSAGKIRSFHHDDNSPSLHIYVQQDKWHDFSTGRQGDVIDLVREFYGCSLGRALQFIERNLGDVDDVDDLVRPAAPELRVVHDLTARYIYESRPIAEANLSVRGYIKQRWPYLSLDTIEQFGVRCTGTSLWIPHTETGVLMSDPRITTTNNVVGVKVRGITGDRYAMKDSTFTQHLYTPFLPDDDIARQSVAVIVEGEPDTWAATQLFDGRGAKAPAAWWYPYGMPSGAGTWRKEWNARLLRHRGVIVATDADEAGDAAFGKIIASLHEANPFFYVQRLTFPWGKDIAEALHVNRHSTGKLVTDAVRSTPGSST